MRVVALPFLASAELFAAAHEVDGEIVLRLSGTADLRVTKQLAEALAVIHDTAGRLNAKRITVDLTALEFMNSSCIKGFVSWLAGLQGHRGASPYSVRFISNPDMLWQRNSLKAIRCMVPDVVTIESGVAS